jgi:hypothetical protein
MTGIDISARTLAGEDPGAPCMIGDWVFHPGFYRAVTGRSIGEDPLRVAIEAFRKVGGNLTPQLAIPRTEDYHPFPSPAPDRPLSPDDIREEIERLPDLESLERDFDLGARAESYAQPILEFREIAGDDILRISNFGHPGFMGAYSRWGYEPFLCALALYPDHMARWFAYTGEQARLHNLAVVEAVRKHSLAPFVYNGDDICFNDGPMCSVEFLREAYFPALRRCIEPLHDGGIRMIWHSDGNILPILGDLLAAGMWGFQGFQEETGPTLEIMASQRTIWGTRPILWGSVSVTRTLPFGTVDDVRADVDRCFETCSGGGFVLAASSSIMPEVPVENILAMYSRGRMVDG